MQHQSWTFPAGGAFYDTAGRPPTLYLGRSSSGDEAVVTWTGGDLYELDVALLDGRSLHAVGRYQDPGSAQVAVASLAADARE